MTEVENVTYLAQFRDWGGEWCDDGRIFTGAREARDSCIGALAEKGYSGVGVRVLRRTTGQFLEVMSGQEVLNA